jgi:hypothetical protein
VISKIVFELSSLTRSTKNRGRAIFVCRCKTFTTWRTDKLKFSNAEFISSQGVEGWRFLITTLKGFCFGVDMCEIERFVEY